MAERSKHPATYSIINTTVITIGECKVGSIVNVKYERGSRNADGEIVNLGKYHAIVLLFICSFLFCPLVFSLMDTLICRQETAVRENFELNSRVARVSTF